jgi:hypothetical protein
VAIIPKPTLLALEADIGDVEREVIGPDAFVLATPVGHPLGAKRSPVKASELRDASVLLLDDGHCFREQALAFCSRARTKELEFRATSLSTLAQMVAGGRRRHAASRDRGVDGSPAGGALHPPLRAAGAEADHRPRMAKALTARAVAAQACGDRAGDVWQGDIVNRRSSAR